MCSLDRSSCGQKLNGSPRSGLEFLDWTKTNLVETKRSENTFDLVRASSKEMSMRKTSPKTRHQNEPDASPFTRFKEPRCRQQTSCAGQGSVKNHKGSAAKASRPQRCNNMSLSTTNAVFKTHVLPLPSDSPTARLRSSQKVKELNVNKA